jgi:DNA-binding response OmpR family regulator
LIAAVYPESFSEALLDGLTLTGASIVGIGELSPEGDTFTDVDVLVVELGLQPMRRVREIDRIAEEVGLPVVVVATTDQMVLLESANGITDFLIEPVDPVEVRLRLMRLVRSESGEDIIRFKDLELNPLTYQALLGNDPMDMTFMEYELLRFLVGNPVRVWSREQLLSRVWGYEYYGGARTVDVHIRRLRAKLGEERSSWITTVRSVGYRFG